MRLFRTAQKKEGAAVRRESCFHLCGFSRAGSAIFRLNCDFPAPKRWKSTKTVCGRNASRTHRDCSKTVLFCPEDLMLVRAGAAARRRFLDTALCQMRPNYARYLEEYNRLHEHKNAHSARQRRKAFPCSPCGRISRCAWRISARRLSATARTTAASCSRPRLPSMQISRRMRCSPVCIRPCRASPTRFADARTIEKQLIDHVFSHKTAEIAAKKLSFRSA